MSKKIGEVLREDGKVLVYVSASLAGVEILADNETKFSPEQARQYAGLLLAATVWVKEHRRAVRAETLCHPPMAEVYGVTAYEIESWGEP